MEGESGANSSKKQGEPVFEGMVECPKLGGQAEKEIVLAIHDDWCRERNLTCCLP